MSITRLSKPSVWKMRDSTEPIPAGERDPFRAARGIIWWFSASLLFWSVVVVVVVVLSG